MKGFINRNIMLVEFSISPMGVGDSISVYVAKALNLIDKSGLPYRVGPMGTVVEGSWEEVMDLIKDCHDLFMMSAPRVYTRIAIDDRQGAAGRLEGKVASLEKHLNRKLKQ